MSNLNLLKAKCLKVYGRNEVRLWLKIFCSCASSSSLKGEKPKQF